MLKIILKTLLRYSISVSKFITTNILKSRKPITIISLCLLIHKQIKDTFSYRMIVVLYSIFTFVFLLISASNYFNLEFDYDNFKNNIIILRPQKKLLR